MLVRNSFTRGFRRHDLWRCSCWDGATALGAVSQPSPLLLLIARNISKAARKRNSGRTAFEFHPPYLPLPEPSEKGKALVDNFTQYDLIASVEAANAWAIQTMEALQLKPLSPLSNSQKILVGLDVGWSFYAKRKLKAPTHIVHVSSPHSDRVASFHLTADTMNVQDASGFPESLRQLLQHPSVLLCGVDINRDLARLRRKMNVYVDTRLELDVLAKVHTPKEKADTTMAFLCQRYLDIEVEPTIGLKCDYSATPLPLQIIQYGALEALHSRLLAETMIKWTPKVEEPLSKEEEEANSKKKKRKIKIVPGSEIDLHHKVVVYFSGKQPVGEGVVQFVGGKMGIAKLFGDLIVNKGKALVRITKILKPHAVPTFNDHTRHLYGMLNYDGKARLHQVYFSKVPVVAVPTSKLKLMDTAVDTAVDTEKEVEPLPMVS